MPDRWTFERLLARGGMGELVLARDDSGRRVVVKRILPAFAGSPEVAAAFAEEARIATRLEHPNIVRVFEAGIANDVPYMAMEWLEGLDLRALLRELLRARAQMHPAQAARIGSRVARALDHAHQLRDDDGSLLGLVHRDVSPRNVFVTRTGEVKLLDFGIAKTRAVATRSGLLAGTPAYMAPEQVDGLHVDARTDLFALGVVLWELLTGRRLWDFDDAVATMNAIRSDPAPPPSTQAEGIRPELDALVANLLGKYPRARPPNARMVSDRLETIAVAHGSKDAAFELAHLVSRFDASLKAR